MLENGRTSYTAVWQLHCFRLKNETSCLEDGMLKKGNQMGGLGSVVPGQAQERSPGLEHHPPSGVEVLPIEASAPQCISHAKEGAGKNQQKAPQAQPIEMVEAMALTHPSIRTLLGSTNWEIPDIAEQMYQGEYVLASSELPFWWQEEYMTEQHQELSQCMARVAPRRDQQQLDPLPRAGDAHAALHPYRLCLPWPGLERPRQPNSQGRTYQWGSSNQGMMCPFQV